MDSWTLHRVQHGGNFSTGVPLKLPVSVGRDSHAILGLTCRRVSRQQFHLRPSAGGSASCLVMQQRGVNPTLVRFRCGRLDEDERWISQEGSAKLRDGDRIIVSGEDADDAAGKKRRTQVQLVLKHHHDAPACDVPARDGGER